MAIALRGVSSDGNGTGTATSLTLARPVGVVAGDVMVAALALDGDRALNAPAGWTLVDNDAFVGVGLDSEFWTYYRVAGESEPANYTWSWTGGLEYAAGLVAFSGVDTSNPIDVAGTNQQNASATNVTAASVTTVTAGCELIFAGTVDNQSTAEVTYTPPAGMTELVDRASDTGRGWASVTIASETLGAPGATGTRTATSNAPSGESMALLVALRPAAAPGVSGEIDATLGNFAPSIQGSPVVSGSLNASFGQFTTAIVGSPIVSGAIATVMQAFTSTMSGATAVVGTMAVTLGNFLSSFFGTVGDVAAAFWSWCCYDDD